jgi:hypothetical protein
VTAPGLHWQIDNDLDLQQLTNRDDWQHSLRVRCPMSSDLSGEITALATAVLAFFAIVAAIFAFLAFRKQSREVGILIEQNDRDIRDRHGDQASRVVIRTGAQAGRGAAFDAGALLYALIH